MFWQGLQGRRPAANGPRDRLGTSPPYRAGAGWDRRLALPESYVFIRRPPPKASGRVPAPPVGCVPTGLPTYGYWRREAVTSTRIHGKQRAQLAIAPGTRISTCLLPKYLHRSRTTGTSVARWLPDCYILSRRGNTKASHRESPSHQGGLLTDMRWHSPLPSRRPYVEVGQGCRVLTPRAAEIDLEGQADGTHLTRLSVVFRSSVRPRETTTSTRARPSHRLDAIP